LLADVLLKESQEKHDTEALPRPEKMTRIFHALRIYGRRATRPSIPWWRMNVAKISGNFSCDNTYSVWVGDASKVITKLVEQTNTQAGQIFRGEVLPPFDEVPECHLYICAHSDDAVYQGLIGSFTGAVAIHTGDPRWRVLATGRNKGNQEFPTQSEINAALATAALTDWKTPFVGAANGGPPWNSKVLSVADEARWIWHDSGKDARPKYPAVPYVPFAGFNHDEFLIFRIPCKEFEPVQPKTERCCVTVNQCCCRCEKEEPKPMIIEKEKAACGSCVFEVRMQRLRYVSGKPGGLFEGGAELSFVAHVDGNQFNYPTGNGSYVKIGKRGGNYWAGWYPVNARVGILEVKCGCTRAFDLMTEMVENPMKEKGIPAVLEGGRPWGASDVATPTIECGKKPAAILQRVKLELGGNRSEDMEVDVEYRISQVSAGSCDCSK
jgi:hypothetical protein